MCHFWLQGYKGYSTLHGLHFSKIGIKSIYRWISKHVTLDYRVTRVTAHYKGCIFLKSQYSRYMDEFLSTSLWVTGLQELQHITMVALFLNQNIVDIWMNFSAPLFGLQGYKGCIFLKSEYSR